jgi:hypothetical protein
LPDLAGKLLINDDLESHKDMFDYLTKVGLLNKKGMNLFFHVINSLENPEEILRICPTMIRALPEEESRQGSISESMMKN